MGILISCQWMSEHDTEPDFCMCNEPSLVKDYEVAQPRRLSDCAECLEVTKEWCYCSNDFKEK